MGTNIAITVLLLEAILIGIWNEEKLIAFENLLIDRAAYITAMIIVAIRRLKRRFSDNPTGVKVIVYKNSLFHAQPRERVKRVSVFK